MKSNRNEMIEQAAALKRLEILLGIITKEDVITWADDIIMQIDSPPAQLLEVSVAGNRSEKELSLLLRELSEGIDVAEMGTGVFRSYCGFLYKSLISNELSPNLIAERLYSLSYETVLKVPDEYAHFCSCINEDFNVFVRGSNRRKEAEEDLLKFLKQFAKPEISQ